MEHTSDDSEGSPRIDVRTLPDSIAQLWETMLRLDPSWDISTWLDERAKEELQLIEGQLGREKLRLEQRLHRLETLAKRLKRQREVAEGVVWKDIVKKVIHQKKVVGMDAMKQVAQEVNATRNDMARVGGFAPSQWVFGNYHDVELENNSTTKVGRIMDPCKHE